MKIGFFITHFKPQRCGVSDYIARMALLLKARGEDCSIIFLEANPSPDGIEPDVELCALDHISLADYNLIAVQYTPQAWKSRMKSAAALKKRGNAQLLLLIHEFWYITTDDSKLSLKDMIVSLRQRLQLHAFKFVARPDHITTTNAYYSGVLGKAGIAAVISPMPGTIPLFPDPQPPDSKPAWLEESAEGNLWVTFGALYTRYWDCDSTFRKFKDSEQQTGKKNYFVICGNQDPEDSRKFLASAKQVGCEDRVHFTGPASIETINWWFERANASFAATKYEFWEKSTGVLTSVERGLPVYFIRGSIAPLENVELLDLFANDPQTALSIPRSMEIAENSVHYPQRASRKFEEDYIVPLKR